jgi:hypothetical protein
MCAGFVETHHPPWVYPLRPAAECLACGMDAGPILYHGARAFFLNTYPVRCNARNTLDRCTRAAGTAARLYARVSSSVVRSGRACTKRCKSERSIGSRRAVGDGLGMHAIDHNSILNSQ